MIEQIKSIIEVSTNEEIKLQLYINIATRLIKNYINNDKFTLEYIKKDFEDIIVLIVVNALTSENDGIRQISEGDTSISYFDNKSFCITDDIKALLPTPFIKMR